MTKHKIDITRPQDYMFHARPEIKIEKFRLREGEPDDSINAVVVSYVDKDGDYNHTMVGIFGNYYTNLHESIFNVILRSEAEKPQEIKKRKVVQISTCMNEKQVITTALCDDGTVFAMGNKRVWHKEVEIPQD